MQAHRRLIAVGLFLASFICLVFVKLNSCSSYIESWLGFTPVYVVETAVVVGGAYFFMPKSPHSEDPVLTVCFCCMHFCMYDFRLVCYVIATCLIPTPQLSYCCFMDVYYTQACLVILGSALCCQHVYCKHVCLRLLSMACAAFMLFCLLVHRIHVVLAKCFWC